MPRRTIFEGQDLKTQRGEAVQALIEFLSGSPCQELPAVVRLANGWQLTKSSKGDAYHMTSQRKSFPGFPFGELAIRTFSQQRDFFANYLP